MKYPRTYHFPFSPGTTSDDRIAKDYSSLIGREIVILEKMDGENCGMTNEGTYARSHTSFTVSNWSKEVRNIQRNISYFIPENLTIFGENMEGIHSIEYTNLQSYFYMFGARRDTLWLSWDEVKEIALILDLYTAPEFFRGVVNSTEELKELVEKFVKQESNLGGKTEGCVVRITDAFETEDFSTSVLKWVRKNHVSTDEFWTKNWKKAKIQGRNY